MKSIAVYCGASDGARPIYADAARALARGCYQVLSMLGPYLRGDTRLLFEKLSEEYLKKLADDGRDLL